MKKLFLPLLFCVAVVLAGCNQLSDKSPEFTDEQPTNPVAPDNDDEYHKGRNWMDTLRPPLNPTLVELQDEKSLDINKIINDTWERKRIDEHTKEPIKVK